MDKELKILTGAILTMLMYGVFLLIDGKPFMIHPLSAITNFGLNLAIVIHLKKFDWRNLFYLFSAVAILFQDPLFMSFFNIEIANYGIEHKTPLAIILIILSNIILFIPMIEVSKRRLIMITGITTISILTFLYIGIYGMFFTAVLGLLYCITSKNKNIEFLKVYNMFFVFILLIQVLAHIIYET